MKEQVLVLCTNMFRLFFLSIGLDKFIEKHVFVPWSVLGVGRGMGVSLSGSTTVSWYI